MDVVLAKLERNSSFDGKKKKRHRTIILTNSCDFFQICLLLLSFPQLFITINSWKSSEKYECEFINDLLQSVHQLFYVIPRISLNF